MIFLCRLRLDRNVQRATETVIVNLVRLLETCLAPGQVLVRTRLIVLEVLGALYALHLWIRCILLTLSVTKNIAIMIVYVVLGLIEMYREQQRLLS